MMVAEIDGREIILKFLNENIDKDFTLSELAEKLSLCLGTISKYVLLLEAEGQVETRRVGRAYLVKLKVVVNGNGL